MNAYIMKGRTQLAVFGVGYDPEAKAGTVSAVKGPPKGVIHGVADSDREFMRNEMVRQLTPQFGEGIAVVFDDEVG